MLEDAGLVNLRTELRVVPMGVEKGENKRDVNCSALALTKTLGFKAGRLGFFKFKREYRKLSPSTQDGLAIPENSSARTYMVHAQKHTV